MSLFFILNSIEIAKLVKKIRSPLIFKEDLFKTNGFCRMNMADEIRRSYQHGDRYQERTNIQQHNPAPMKFYRYCTDVVRSRVQFERLKEILDDAECQSDDISPTHPSSDEEHRERQKDLPDGGIVSPQRFQNPNHLRTFENDNQQARNHGKARYPSHQNQDNPHVCVEQIQPGKNLRIEFFRRT